MNYSRFILAVVFISVCSISSKISYAEIPIYSTDKTALAGYDVVAYFLDEKALKGNLKYSYQWLGVTWLFVSQQHRDLFVRSPDSYQPMFGGFCGLGAAHGALVPADPEAWTIHKGQLILNQDKEVTTTWRYNADLNIERAQQSYETAVTRYLRYQSKIQHSQIGVKK